jgi:hypothetical protein
MGETSLLVQVGRRTDSTTTDDPRDVNPSQTSIIWNESIHVDHGQGQETKVTFPLVNIAV